MKENRAVRHSLDNFCSAISSLDEFVSEPIVNNRDRAGIIQAFEYSFELAWKTIQKYSAYQGITVNSPRLCLKEAVKFGLIELTDENLWNKMLQDRNLTSHTYRQELAVEVVDRIVRDHLRVLAELSERLSHALEEDR